MPDNDPRIVNRFEKNAATSFRDNAEGPPVEEKAVTERPNDTGPDGPGDNATLAGRKAKRDKADAKAVSSVKAEDKAVSSVKAEDKSLKSASKK